MLRLGERELDFVSRISDVKGIQDLCKLIVIPLMAAAYISSTGFEIVVDDWSLAITPETSGARLWFFFILIFLGKVLWVSFWAALAAGAVLVSEIKYPDATKIYSIIFLSFGFMGVAAPDILPVSEFMNPFWYYAAIATGFCLPKLSEEIHGNKT